MQSEIFKQLKYSTISLHIIKNPLIFISGLIAYLLIEKVVPRENMVNLLWGDLSEDSAASCLSSYM
jgi:hypothetical protein